MAEENIKDDCEEWKKENKSDKMQLHIFQFRIPERVKFVYTHLPIKTTYKLFSLNPSQLVSKVN